MVCSYKSHAPSILYTQIFRKYADATDWRRLCRLKAITALLTHCRQYWKFDQKTPRMRLVGAMLLFRWFAITQLDITFPCLCFGQSNVEVPPAEPWYEYSVYFVVVVALILNYANRSYSWSTDTDTDCGTSRVENTKKSMRHARRKYWTLHSIPKTLTQWRLDPLARNKKSISLIIIIILYVCVCIVYILILFRLAYDQRCCNSKLHSEYTVPLYHNHPHFTHQSLLLVDWS